MTVRYVIAADPRAAAKLAFLIHGGRLPSLYAGPAACLEAWFAYPSFQSRYHPYAVRLEGEPCVRVTATNRLDRTVISIASRLPILDRR